jgi:hypothetical protein
MAVVMLLGAFPFDHARQHAGAVDDEALDLWCGPGRCFFSMFLFFLFCLFFAPRRTAQCWHARSAADRRSLGKSEWSPAAWPAWFAVSTQR